ncbi:MAG: hypothetical protein ACRCSY_07960 [Cetobacterium sp.]
MKTISEKNLAKITGLSERTVREKFKDYKVAPATYDYFKIGTDAIADVYGKKEDNKNYMVNATTLAMIFGVDEKTIRNYTKKNILTCDNEGMYNLELSVRDFNDKNKYIEKELEHKKTSLTREVERLTSLEEKYGDYLTTMQFRALLNLVITKSEKMLKTFSDNVYNHFKKMNFENMTILEIRAEYEKLVIKYFTLENVSVMESSIFEDFEKTYLELEQKYTKDTSQE